ncbi:Cornichon family protein [Prunus dulcis]|uniref:Cornichon family protein n=1 Tax=Prunus dulcis TaxID=3755 RepID=A0A4Y1RGM7_PRUDU|nr:Cornichon family protein [Prunus dulcis]
MVMEFFESHGFLFSPFSWRLELSSNPNVKLKPKPKYHHEGVLLEEFPGAYKQMKYQKNLPILMCLADLEFDYINPYDSSNRINRVILPEYIAEGVLGAFFLLTGHWCMSLFCGPYLYYNVKLYMRRQHLVDVTEIFNMLHKEKKIRLFKLFYLVFLLFLSIFWMILTALEDHE